MNIGIVKRISRLKKQLSEQEQEIIRLDSEVKTKEDKKKDTEEANVNSNKSRS